MKRKEINDLRNKSVKQLQELLNKKKVEGMQIKAKLKVAKEKNLKRVKNLKKEVAQIKTVIHEKELMENNLNKKEKTKENKKKGDEEK